MPHFKRKRPRRKVKDSLASDNRIGNSNQTDRHPKHLPMVKSKRRKLEE